jgi:hypothetical protein
MRNWAIAAVVLLIAFSGVAVGFYLNPAGVPPVTAYSEGIEIKFIHTEASDPKVAELLTDMMRSPVLTVASLANAPESMLANVFVFKNGVRGAGPFGFQPDVFDHPAGTEGYRPLRSVVLVSWKNEGASRKLKSAAEVKAAIDIGEVTTETPGVVVNMPLLTWPGGRR